MSNYYETLEVPSNASDKEIKQAYRRLAQLHHPDHNGSRDSEKFNAINEAYTVLSNRITRQEYDSTETLRSNIGSIHFGSGPHFDVHFSDIFERFSRQQPHNTKPSASNPKPAETGDPVKTRLNISFEEALLGSERTITISRLEDCSECDGSGNEGGRQSECCGLCNGTGSMTEPQQTPFGIFNHPKLCSNCNGTGEEIYEKCSRCQGGKLQEVSRTLPITIPPGAENKTQLRLKKQGHSSRTGGLPGDLYIMLLVPKTSNFEIRGSNLYLNLKISYLKFLLGGPYLVQTLEGDLLLEIPPCSQPNRVLKIEGKGVPTIGDPQQRGDLLVELVVEFPDQLTPEEIQLLQSLAQLDQSSHASACP